MGLRVSGFRALGFRVFEGFLRTPVRVYRVYVLELGV